LASATDELALGLGLGLADNLLGLFLLGVEDRGHLLLVELDAGVNFELRTGIKSNPTNRNTVKDVREHRS